MKSNLVFFIGMIAVLVSACGGVKEVQRPITEPSQQVDLVSKMYLDGVKERVLQNYPQATDHFWNVIKEDATYAPAYFELARIEIEQKDFLKAEEHIENAVKYDPDNKWFKITYADVLKKQQKFRESIKIYEEIIDQFSDNPELYYEIAMMHLYLGQDEDAIAYYNKIEEVIGMSRQLSMQKHKLYMQLDQKDKAIAEIEKLIDYQPRELNNYNFLANLYIREKQFEEAEALYKRVKVIAPNDAYIHISLADLYRKMGQNDKAFQELKIGFSNPNLKLDTKIQILVSYYSMSEIYSDQKAQAFALSEALIKVHPNESKSHSIYADFLYKDNQQKKALIHFKKAVELDQASFFNWESLLNILLQEGDFNDLKSWADKAQELFPMQPTVYLFAGISEIQLKNYEEARKLMEAGIQLVVDNKMLEVQFSIYLGDVCNELKDYPASDKYFENAISGDPTNSYTLNNYSYYLSLRGEKLEKAVEYAKQAVRLDEDNANNQDTYGWVLFELKRYEEAKFWIEKSINTSDDPSGVVLEHLGDVYFELGEVEKAVFYWKQASEKGETSEMIEKKINTKKRLVE